MQAYITLGQKKKKKKTIVCCRKRSIFYLINIINLCEAVKQHTENVARGGGSAEQQEEYVTNVIQFI